MIIDGKNNGDGTWQAELDELSPGDYTMTVTATDPDTGETAQATATLTITESATPPTLTANNVTGTQAAPALAGTISDADSTIVITIPVNGTPRDYTATNNGDGTWTLAAGTYPDQDAGQHTFNVVASNSAGNDNTTLLLTVNSSDTSGETDSNTPHDFSAMQFSGSETGSYRPQAVYSSDTEIGRSFLFWMRVDDMPESGISTPLSLGELYGAMAFELRSDGDWIVRLTTLSAQSGGGIFARNVGRPDGWRLVVLTYEVSGEANLYIVPENGAATAEVSAKVAGGVLTNGSPALNYQPQFRSRLNDPENVGFSGAVSNYAYFDNLVLSASQIESLAAGALPNEVGTPAVWHKLDGPSDIYGYGEYHGVLDLIGSTPQTTAAPSVLPQNTLSYVDGGYPDSISPNGGDETRRSGGGTDNTDDSGAPNGGSSGGGSVRLTADAATVTADNPAPDLAGTVSPADNAVLITVKNDDGVAVHEATNDGNGGWTLPGTTYGGFGSDARGRFKIAISSYDENGDGYFAYPEIQVEGTTTPVKGSDVEVVLDHSMFYDAEGLHPTQVTSLQGINDYSPNPDRVIPERRPVDPYPHFDPPVADPGGLPTVDVVFEDRESGETWRLDDAPVGLTPIKRSDGSDHRNLAVCRHRDCVMLENTWHDSDGSYAGNYLVYVDGELVFQEDEILMFRWTRTVPVRNSQPQLPFHPIDPALLPPFDYSLAGTIGDDRYNGALGPSSVNSNGQIWFQDLNRGGGHWYIGLLEGAGAQYAVDPNVKTASAARHVTDHSTVWGMHVRDRATRRPLKITDHPSFTTDYRHQEDPNNPAVHYNELTDNIPESPAFAYNVAHQPGFGIATALATGADFDREEVEFHGNCGAGLNWIAAWRGYDKGYCWDNQVRSQAWATRSLVYAAVIAHDDMTEYFDQIMRNNIEKQLELYGPNGTLCNGLHIKPTSAWADGHVDYMGVAPWEEDYLHGALNLVVRLGFTDWVPIRDYFCTNNVQRFTEMCYQNAVDYSLRAKTEPHGPISVDNWADVIRLHFHNNESYKTQMANGAVCGMIEKYGNPGDMYGYPKSPWGYAAWMQPALAGAVDAELNGAAEAWEVFMTQRSTYPDYSNTPNFAVVPDSKATYPDYDYSQTVMADPAVFVDGEGSNDRTHR